MAGLVSCALKAVDNKQISQETADKLRAEAADFDPEEVIKAELSDAYLKRRQTAIQVIKTLETLDNANSHPEGLRAGVTALLVKDKFSKVGYNNVDSQSKALLGIYDAMMTDLLYRHKRTFAGLRKGESMDSIIRSMYGRKCK